MNKERMKIDFKGSAFHVEIIEMILNKTLCRQTSNDKDLQR